MREEIYSLDFNYGEYGLEMKTLSSESIDYTQNIVIKYPKTSFNFGYSLVDWWADKSFNYNGWWGKRGLCSDERK